MQSSFSRRRQAAVGALLSLSLILAACQSGAAPPPVELTPVGGEGSGTPAAGATPGTAVAGRAATPTAAQGLVVTAEGTVTPGAIGNITVSPTDVTLGNVVLTLALQPAQPVVDPARVAVNQPSGGQQTPAAGPRGFAVLGGAGTKVTNNFDTSQNPPADSEREVLRHVALQIRDKDSQQLIPHINVSMDLLRDGRPVLQDQPLAPMVPAGGNVTQLQYGNNVKFPGRGDYQVFIRLEPSPLLGPGASGAAQFNVSMR